MTSNNNYNRHRSGLSDNNDQNTETKTSGEFKNGRLSPFKNHNPMGSDIPNEYIDMKDEE